MREEAESGYNLTYVPIASTVMTLRIPFAYAAAVAEPYFLPRHS